MAESDHDSTLVYDPVEDDIEMAGGVRCPECDKSIFPELDDETMTTALRSEVHAFCDCPRCDTALEFIIKPLLTDAIGVGVSVIQHKDHSR